MSDDSDAFYRSLLKGGGVVMIGTVLQLAISFVGMALIARFFGRTDYGAVSLGLTVMEFAAAISLLGLNTGVARYLPRYDSTADRRGVLVSAMQLALPTAVVVGIGIVVFAPTIATRAFDDSSVTPILRVVGATVPAVALVRMGTGAVQGLQLSRGKVVIQNLTLPITRIVLIGCVLLFGFGVVGIALSYSLAYVAAALAALYYLYRYTPLFASTDATNLRRPLITFSAPLIVGMTMGRVLTEIDTLLLGVSSAASTGDVGVYRAVYPIASLLPFVLTALGFMFLPLISELHANGRIAEMRRMFQVVTKWTVFATIPLFFAVAFFPDSVIGITFGPDFLSGATALQVLALAFFLPLLAGPNTNLLTTIGSTRTIMYNDIATAAVNVGLNLLLIPQYSFLGAAIATAVAYVFKNVVYSAQVYQKTGTHPITASLAKPLVASLCAGIVLYLAVIETVRVTTLVFLAVVAGFTIVHGVLVLTLGGVEREEVMLVLSFEERFGVDLGPLKQIANRLM